MSTMIVPNEGRQRMLDMLTAGTGLGAVRIKLIKASFTLSKSMVYADLTFADFSGYADATPSYGGATVVSDKAQALDATRTWTHNGGPTANTIYGYAVVDTALNKLLKVQKEDVPTVLGVSGDAYNVTDKLTLTTDPSPT